MIDAYLIYKQVEKTAPEQWKVQLLTDAKMIDSIGFYIQVESVYQEYLTIERSRRERERKHGIK